MTATPRTVDSDASLAQAHEIMREEGFRHLPVLERGKLAGLISQRDLHLMETLRDVDPQTVRVHEAMVTHPYFVGPEARLDEVVAEMADHKFGAAVVMEESRVIGMFTTVDALRAFVDFLRGELAAEEAPRPEATPGPALRPPPSRAAKPAARARQRPRQSE
jgi:acetoin utilization protein AcuB